MLRTEALKLYRNILRQLNNLPDKEQRKEIKDWARSDFEAHRHHEDEVIGLISVYLTISTSFMTELHPLFMSVM